MKALNSLLQSSQRINSRNIYTIIHKKFGSKTHQNNSFTLFGSDYNNHQTPDKKKFHRDLEQYTSLQPINKRVATDILNLINNYAEETLTPSKLVKELDKYIVSQTKPKKIIAQAIRNKYRKRKITGEIKEYIRPSNILIFGKSGSGKTEIFRQIARIYNAPFIRVEATRYTEVGYHGEDIMNIISDLFKKTFTEFTKNINKLIEDSPLIKEMVENAILKIYLGLDYHTHSILSEIRKALQEGHMDELMLIIYQMRDENIVQEEVLVKNLRTSITHEYTTRILQFINRPQFVKKQIEDRGIIVIDEIDKLVNEGKETQSHVSDKGVQYDLLPLLDGTTITISQPRLEIDTSNILFVGSGAFEKVKPEELVTELQGRLPIQIGMDTLTQEDFVKILKDTQYNLLEQQILMLGVEDLEIKITMESIQQMARIAYELNREEEDTGARRLKTVLDKVLDEINFDAPDMQKGAIFMITSDYVINKTKDLFKHKNYTRLMM